MDINSILSAMTANAGQQIADVNAAVQRQTVDTGRIGQLLAANEQEAVKAGEAAAEIARAEAETNYKLNKAKEFNAAVGGMNPDDLNNQYIRSFAEFDAAEAERVRAYAEFEEKARIGFLDNPVGYLIAQLQLPQLADANNSAVARRDAAKENVLSRVEMIEARNRILSANTADQVREVQLRKAAVAKQAADISLREAQAENISKLGARELEALRLRQEPARIQGDLLRTEMSVKQWQAQQEANRIQRAAAAEAARANAEAKAASIEQKNEWNARLAAASRMLNYKADITVDSIKMLPSKAQQDALWSIAATGQLGNDVDESLATIQAAGANVRAMAATNAGLGRFVERTQRSISAFGEAIKREAEKKAVGSSDKIKPEVLRREATSQWEAETYNAAHSRAGAGAINSGRWDDTSNFSPYKPEYFVVLDMVDGGQLPGLSKNSAVEVLRNLKATSSPGASNLPGKDIERLAHILAERVANGTLGPETAARDLVALQQTGVRVNKNLYNYTQMGMKEQTAAILNIPSPASFGDPVKFDSLNLAETKAALVKLAAQRSTTRNIFEALKPALLAPLDPDNKLPGMIERERAAAAAAASKPQ